MAGHLGPDLSKQLDSLYRIDHDLGFNVVPAWELIALRRIQSHLELAQHTPPARTKETMTQNQLHFF